MVLREFVNAVLFFASVGVLAGRIFYFRPGGEHWILYRGALRPLGVWLLFLGMVDTLQGVFFSLFMAWLCVWIWDNKVVPMLFTGDDGDGVIRGASMTSGRAIQKLLDGNKTRYDMILAGVPIPVEAEPYHFLLSGGTGQGKSVAFIEMLDAIKLRNHENEKAVIVDSGGAFYSRYAENMPGAVLLNPFDVRSADWSPFAEMRAPWDADSLAKSIVPTGAGDGAEWAVYAQNLLSGILLRLYEHGATATNGNLYHCACIATPEELRPLVEGLPASVMLAEGNERMFGSVRAIVSSALQPFSYLNPATGRDGFSVRGFVENKGNGWLFLTYKDDQLSSLKPIIAAMLDIASRAVLSQDPDRDRRTWLMVDECASLGKVNTLPDFLTKARKSGGCAVIGLQNVSQFRDPAAYGQHMANVMLSSLSSWLVLKVTDAETSEYLSKFLGDQEVLRLNATTGGERDTASEQIANQRMILPSEIQRLQVRHGFFSLTGYGIAHAYLDLPQDLPGKAETFVARYASPALAISAPVAQQPDQHPAQPHTSPVVETAELTDDSQQQHEQATEQLQPQPQTEHHHEAEQSLAQNLQAVNGYWIDTNTGQIVRPLNALELELHPARKINLDDATDDTTGGRHGHGHDIFD